MQGGITLFLTGKRIFLIFSISEYCEFVGLLITFSQMVILFGETAVPRIHLRTIVIVTFEVKHSMH